MIWFVIAMENEAAPVIAAMNVESDNVFYNKRIVKGTLHGKQAGVVVCGVGKVNAAAGTALTLLYSEGKPECIVNLGVAGGLNGGVAVGEIYGISKAVQYDFDLTQLNGTDIGTLDECKENYLSLSTPSVYPCKLLGTGDRFNDSKTDYRLLTDVLKADIRDMEGGAVAQVCMHLNIPCAEFKIISDLAGSGSTTEQYLKNLTLCFNTLKRELKNIVEAING